ncbi:hypothetical protein GCM10027053_45630 [Intrasporangium mesophilum]
MSQDATDQPSDDARNAAKAADAASTAGAPSSALASGLGRRRDLRDARTLRPGSAVGISVAGGIVGLALLVPAVGTSQRSWTLISSIVLGLVLLWLFVYRPCAVIHAEGIRLVNPMRVVDLTWPAISEVRSRWTLELFSDGKRYTAWGVPADPGRPRHGRQLLTIPTNRLKQKSAADAEPKKPKLDAQLVAAEVEERMAADRRRKDGRTPRIAVQHWDPVAVGLLLAAVAFFVIGTFVV